MNHPVSIDSPATSADDALVTSSRRQLLFAGIGIGSFALPGLAWAAPEDPLAHVDPELRPVARKWLADAAAPGGIVRAVPPKIQPMPAGVTRQMVPVPGAPPVAVYVIGAEKGAPVTGGILYLHGGGYIYRSATEDFAYLKAMAIRLGCVIVTVEYRLAPGTRYPGSLEDNYAALKWMVANAAGIGVDPARIALMGISAGGGHAAMLAIAARDRAEVRPAFQALLYPMLDDRTRATRRAPKNIGTIIWTEEDNRRGWSALLGQPAGMKKVPAGSVPARAADLAGLPPTFIGVSGLDLFAGEDIDYARRLNDAGVPTELLVVPGAYHAFDRVVPEARVSTQFTLALEAALTRALTLPGQGR